MADGFINSLRMKKIILLSFFIFFTCFAFGQTFNNSVLFNKTAVFKGKTFVSDTTFILTGYGDTCIWRVMPTYLRCTCTSGIDSVYFDPAIAGSSGGGGASVNIYNSDGTLTGNRAVDGGGQGIDFNNLIEFGIGVDLSDVTAIQLYAQSIFEIVSTSGLTISAARTDIAGIGSGGIKLEVGGSDSLYALNIDRLQRSQSKPMFIDTISGRVSYADASGGSLSTLTNGYGISSSGTYNGSTARTFSVDTSIIETRYWNFPRIINIGSGAVIDSASITGFYSDVIDLDSKTGVTLQNITMGGGGTITIDANSTTVRSARIGAWATLIATGTVEYIEVGERSALTTAGTTTKGIMVAPSSNTAIIGVDLSIASEYYNSSFFQSFTAGAGIDNTGLHYTANYQHTSLQNGADITATDIDGTEQPGAYEISMYINTHDSDLTAGAVSLYIGWTDASGTPQEQLYIQTQLIVTEIITGGAGQIMVPFRHTAPAGAKMTFRTENSGIYGTATYDLFLQATKKASF